MKREGRQHGMVRTCGIIPSPWNPRPNARIVNQIESPPTYGLFTKVSTKPTNHSKFTGKCGKPRCSGCRLNPVCKAKDKTKGSQKLKSRDVVIDCPLVAWRFLDGQPGFVDDDENDDQVLEVEVTAFESRMETIDYVDDNEMGYTHVGLVVDEAVEGDDIWCLVEEQK